MLGTRAGDPGWGPLLCVFEVSLKQDLVLSFEQLLDLEVRSPFVGCVFVVDKILVLRTSNF